MRVRGAKCLLAGRELAGGQQAQAPWVLWGRRSGLRGEGSCARPCSDRHQCPPRRWPCPRCLTQLPGASQRPELDVGPLAGARACVLTWPRVSPSDLFQKLFRQDLLVASLFRNFLLAERIMRSYNCTPVSSPRLPPTYMHAMW